jgi:hypothetical protein
MSAKRGKEEVGRGNLIWKLEVRVDLFGMFVFYSVKCSFIFRRQEMSWVVRKREAAEIRVKIREIVGWGGAGIKGQ